MPDDPTIERDLVTVAEARELLPVAASTIRDLFHDGTLPGLKVVRKNGGRGTILLFRQGILDYIRLGVSVENQASADERIPDLLRTNAAMHFARRTPAQEEGEAMIAPVDRAPVATYSGRTFDVLHPDPNLVSPVDIARSLAQTSRFGGHLNTWWSVADHTLLVAKFAKEMGAGRIPVLVGHALLHDAAEAYVGDVVTPVKRRLVDFGVIERGVRLAILKRFGLPAMTGPEAGQLSQFDAAACAAEAEVMLPGANPKEWYGPAYDVFLVRKMRAVVEQMAETREVRARGFVAWLRRVVPFVKEIPPRIERVVTPADTEEALLDRLLGLKMRVVLL